MHGAAADFAAGFQNRFVNMMSPHTPAAEARQKRGMYIHHPVFKPGRNFPKAKPAALHNKLDLSGNQLPFNTFAELIYIGMVLCPSDFNIETGSFGPFDAGNG
jgi:hypothetical protein